MNSVGVEKQEGWEGAEFTRMQRWGLASSRGPVGMARRGESGPRCSGLGPWGKVGSAPQSGRSKAGPGEVRLESEVPGGGMRGSTSTQESGRGSSYDFR